MNISLSRFLHALASLFLPAFLTAQVIPDSLQSMTWPQLIEKWEALAVKGKDLAALPYASTALAKALKDSSQTSLAYGSSLDYLGYTLHHIGQYPEAEKNLQAGVEHASKYLSEGDEEYCARLCNLAMLHMDMGKLAQAVSGLERCVSLAEKYLEPDNFNLGIFVNNLGLAYEKSGDLDRALKYYFKALELTEKTYGPDSYKYAIRLNNISAIYRETGQNELALEYIRKSLAIHEKTVGKQHLGYLLCMGNTITILALNKRYDEALEMSDSILYYLDRQSVKERIEVYDILTAVTKLYLSAGLNERCITFGKQTLDKYMNLFPKVYNRHLLLAYFILQALEKENRIEEANQYALLNIRLALSDFRKTFSEFSEQEQLKLYRAQRENTDHLSLWFAFRHPETPELNSAAFEYQMTVKGMSLANRRQLFEALHAQAEGDVSAEFEEWKNLQNSIAKIYASAPSRRKGNPDSLQNRSNELERNLVRKSESFRLASQEAHWQELQKALGPGEAAIEFTQVQHPKNDSTVYLAYLLKSDGRPPRQIYLFEAKEIGKLSAVKKLYAPDSVEDSKNLRNLLWNPLAPFLNGVRTLYYAPAGILHRVNMDAVPISDTEVMADRFALHRLVSTRKLFELKKETAKERLPSSALVYGGIRYETDSTALLATNLAVALQEMPGIVNTERSAVSQGQEWGFLQGTYQEALSVSKQLKNAGASVSLAQGFEASEGLFKKTILQTPAPSVIHLATHGFFISQPDTNGNSGFTSAQNPMVRTGLILAGANRAWGGGEPLAGQEDGILTAQEISRMDLGGTELAVLSACGTGLGELEAGEGVFGLQRAFKMAGVHYVIMTLWNVQDQDAQQFMDLFYDQWLSQKKSVPDAFRVAQQKMRALHSKPFQPMAWAGFLLLE